MAGKPQRSSGSLAPMEQQVLREFRQLITEVSAEPILIRQLQERLPGIPLAVLSPVLERLSRLGKLAIQKNGPLVAVVFSSSDALGRLMAQQQGAILSSGKTGQVTVVEVSRQPTEPCEHAAAVLAEYEELVAEFREVSSRLQEAERQNEELVRAATKASNKQRKAEADLQQAKSAAEESQRKLAASTSEARDLRKQIEERQEQTELISALRQKIKELEERESVSGPLADRIIAFFA